MTPLPHQLVGADFLSARKTGLLADAPRVGKTGAAIIAADYVGARRVLTITTASGRPVWTRAWAAWSAFARPVATCYGALSPVQLEADRLIVGWPSLPKFAADLARHPWDLIIVDESHYAKGVGAQRTRALYEGVTPLHTRAEHVWCLSGTPIANAPNDLFPMLRALAPERLAAHNGWPDVSTYEAFLARYCVVRRKKLKWNWIEVVVNGRNLEELRARMEGFWLRRTQADIGITAPIYEVLPLHIDTAQRRKIEAEAPHAKMLLEAAETGETQSLDMHLGTLRRITGTLKAAGVAQVVKDEIEGGLDKIVVMAWHKDTLDRLETALGSLGCVRVDGSTSPAERDRRVAAFGSPATKVFLGQIIACGEAIDLSAAADLIFAESSWVPKDMTQAAQRIVNIGQKRQPRVRVAALEGTIDDALQTILTRKISVNKRVI